jgi:hypothetical protein
MELGQHHSVATVRLDPVSRFHRNARRRLDRGSPRRNHGHAVANPRMRACSTVVSDPASCRGHEQNQRLGAARPIGLPRRSLTVKGAHHARTENLHKRYLIHVARFNLGVLRRVQLSGDHCAPTWTSGQNQTIESIESERSPRRSFWTPEPSQPKDVRDLAMLGWPYLRRTCNLVHRS